MPLAAAIARPVQWVASPGGSARVSSTTRSIRAEGKGGRPGLRVLSRNSPATPSRINRSCQRHTHGFETPARRIIAAVPQPSAVARMICARHTCFCRLLRSATTAASRSRSAALTSMLIPSRIQHHCTDPANMESYDCVLPLGASDAKTPSDSRFENAVKTKKTLETPPELPDNVIVTVQLKTLARPRATVSGCPSPSAKLSRGATCECPCATSALDQLE